MQAGDDMRRDPGDISFGKASEFGIAGIDPDVLALPAFGPDRALVQTGGGDADLFPRDNGDGSAGLGVQILVSPGDPLAAVFDVDQTLAVVLQAGPSVDAMEFLPDAVPGHEGGALMTLSGFGLGLDPFVHFADAAGNGVFAGVVVTVASLADVQPVPLPASALLLLGGLAALGLAARHRHPVPRRCPAYLGCRTAAPFSQGNQKKS
ncbi:MAG TPA: VPLPA-CTERM sorting domain-containing protein [Rhodovulum sp.]|nr:VPLPA-CTERM sorting domain-containing protein [Rhodovulum sp.]